MIKPPFKTEGIYARIMNPEKELWHERRLTPLEMVSGQKIKPDEKLVNYKQTKLGNIFNAAIGKKEEVFYRIICFKEIHNKTEEKQFGVYNFWCCADNDVFGLADRYTGQYTTSNFKNVIFDRNSCKFFDKEIPFYCYFRSDGDILKLKIGDMDYQYLRYVPSVEYY